MSFPFHHLSLIRKDLIAVLPFNVKEKVQAQKWLNQLHASLDQIRDVTPAQARIRFVGMLVKWRLFGCTFYEVKVPTALSTGETRLVAIGKEGIFMLKNSTHVSWMGSIFTYYK